MPQNINRGIVIGIVIVLALTGFFLIRGRDINPSAIDFEGVYSINDITAMNKNTECVFQKTDGTAELQGNVFFSEGRVRGEFDIKSIEQAFKNYFIMRDGMIYTWTSIINAGFKYALAGDTTMSGSNVVSPDEKLNFKCNVWTEKKGAFDIPRDIQFSSI